LFVCLFVFCLSFGLLCQPRSAGLSNIGHPRSCCPDLPCLAQILKCIRCVASLSCSMKYNVVRHNSVYGPFVQSALLSECPECVTVLCGVLMISFLFMYRKKQLVSFIAVKGLMWTVTMTRKRSQQKYGRHKLFSHRTMLFASIPPTDL
jgi:hypothetical protein